MDAGRVRALFPTFSRDVLPQWRPFGHIACWCNVVFRFLQATLETCSSSQFRASRFIALSLQTIRREITCNYNSSLANILNCQASSILRMCQHRCDILSAHTKHGGFGFIKFCKFTMERQISLEIIGISAFWVTGFLTANRLLSNTAEETDFLNGLPFAI